MKYRILREEYYNEVGVSTKVFFTVKKLNYFLWFRWWSYIKTKNCSGACYNEVIKFNSFWDAEKFVNEVLKKNRPKEKWYIMVMKEIE